MSGVFAGDILVYKNTAIPLKYVESMGFGVADEDKTFDQLKDDRTLKIRTLSGMEYEISTRDQLNTWQLTSPNLNLDLWRQAIFDKWKHLLTGKS